MSAIFGIVRFDGGDVGPREVDRMAAILAHRGRDGCETVAIDAVGLGHCLTRVNVEDVHEAQPLHDREAGLLLVADIRIDNREAIAAAIGIALDALAEMADSAVLLAAYRHWGKACVDHVLGDFAFALWDARARRLLLARDPMGQRGVYYHLGDGFFAFASEPRALWAVTGVPRALSRTAIGRRLMMPIDGPDGATLFEGIRALRGGHVATLAADGTLAERRYWTPHAAPEHVGRDAAYYVATYRRLVEEAIACRVRRLADPPALMLSGGFDSGTIAAVAGPIVAAQGRRIIAIASMLAAGERGVMRDARAAVAAFEGRPGLDIRRYVRPEGEGIFTDLETSFAANDGAADTIERAACRIAEAGGARLMIDGNGGDYTVNVRSGQMLGRILRRGDFVTFLRELRARRRATGWSWARIVHTDLLYAFLPIGWRSAMYTIRRGFRPIWLTRPANRAFAEALIADGTIDPARLRDAVVLHARWKDRLIAILDKVAAGGPRMATVAGQCGMAFTRPFHDRRIVEFGLAIPEALQFRDGRERHVARTALADLLPARLLASGPGNDAREPDRFRMLHESAAAELARARADDRDGSVAGIIDFDAIAAILADVRETRLADHQPMNIAANAIVLARYIRWFDRGNAGR